MQLLAKKHLENFQVLLSTLREFATPSLKYFKKFKGFGLAEMISCFKKIICVCMYIRMREGLSRAIMQQAI